MNLKITSGSESVELTNGSTALISEFRPGKEPVEIKEVDLFADVILLGARSAVQTTMNSVDALLDNARRAQRDLTLEKVYVEVDTGGGYVRSEILDGNLETESDYFDRLSRNHAPVRLWIRRKNYWEGAEAQLPLTNENGTNNTAGLTIYNTNDLTGTAPNKRVNYAKVTGAQVLGSIPTPPRIEMTNTYPAVGARISNVWLGRSIDNATYPLQWFINHSVTKNWTFDTEQEISLITLNQTFLNGTNGGHYRVFTKLGAGTYQDLRLRASLYFPASVALTPMQKAPEVVTGGYTVVDLGTLQIPPWLPNLRGQTDIGLRIVGRRTGGYSVTVGDIFLFPATAFRQLIPRGYGIAQTIRLVDDGIADRVWTDGWTPAGKTGHYSGYGDLITLIPGKDQRLLFLTSTMSGGNADDITMSVKVFYRPRRLTP